ncbi:hypothetical protein [Nocardia sp. NPDC051929]|uniref:hypothetical protein n=1 Tax=Nocardia TaxID=1817 RepID=UPI0037C9D829
MARPVTLPPTKGVGLQLSRDVVDAVQEAAKAHGLTQRAVYELALRRLLGLPDYPGLPPSHQEALKLPA